MNDPQKSELIISLLKRVIHEADKGHNIYNAIMRTCPPADTERDNYQILAIVVRNHTNQFMLTWAGDPSISHHTKVTVLEELIEKEKVPCRPMIRMLTSIKTRQLSLSK